MAVQGIEHAALAFPAGRLDEARAFYVGVLGLTALPRPDTITTPGMWLQCGPSQVHLVNDPNFAAPAAAHLAVIVDDLPAVVRTLEAAGHSAKPLNPLAGRQRALTLDPFGNRIELVAGTA